jgi:hypothetical protein
MSYDPLDVIGGALGSIIKRLLYFASAVWIGSMVGVVSSLVAYLISGGTPETGMLWAFLFAPLVMINSWIALNFLIIAVGLAYSIWATDPGYRGWMILAVASSIGVKMDAKNTFGGAWLPVTAGWVCWLVLLVMLGTGVWMVCQYFLSSWAHHFHHVQAENVGRGATREEIAKARLEASRPPAAPPAVHVDLKR